MGTHHVLRAKRPESLGGRPAARTPARETPAAARSLAPGGRKCVRQTEVLPQRASASPGLSGRRGPWLFTLRTWGLRRGGNPEILERLSGSGRGGPRSLGALGSRRPLAGAGAQPSPAAAGPRAGRSSTLPRGDRIGAVAGLPPDRARKAESKRGSLPAGSGKRRALRPPFSVPPGLDSFPPGESASGVSLITPSLGSFSERPPSSPSPHEARLMSS